MIDGVPLSNAVYGAASPAAITVDGFDTKDGADKSNVVRIKLGKKWAENNKARQIYMQAGNHSVQVSNVGDAANRTDIYNNKLITQSLDFTIDPDDSLIEATVEVQSPEQYIVTLSKEIDDPVETLKDELKLQIWNASTGQYVDETRQDIEVHAIDTDNKKFRIDTTRDWTQVYTTKSSHKNYYNDIYRLYIPQGKIENPGNGKMNAEISMVLDDVIMKNPDVTSPEILGVNLNSDKKSFNISLSEPVQVPGYMGTEADVTPNETQAADEKTGVPMPTVSFIKKDLSATIPARIDGVDAYHSTITVAPTAELSAGIWDVVVYSISDDVGNTAATLVEHDFEVKSTVVAEDAFKALWIVAVPAGVDDPITATGGAMTKNADDVVYIKYNKNIATAGSSANVVSTANYQVNGYSIPVSTKIDVSIENYNKNVLDIYGVSGVKDTIAIHLNKNTLANDSNNVFIAETLQSFRGSKIANGGLKTLDKVTSGSNAGIFKWQYNTVSAGTDVDTVEELKTAIASDENIAVTAATLTDADATKDAYTISKAMTVDFGNNGAKSLTIETEATGTITVKNLTVEDVTINAPYANVVFVDVTVTKTNEKGDKEGKVTLKNVCGSFTLDGNINILDITADVTHDITVIGNSSTITTLNNNAQAAVTLDPLTVVTLNQNSAKMLVLDDVTITTLNIKAAASLKFTGTASAVTTLNVQKDIKIASVDNSNGSAVTVYKDVTFNTDGSVKDAGTSSDLAGVSTTVVPTPGTTPSTPATKGAISAS